MLNKILTLARKAFIGQIGLLCFALLPVIIGAAIYFLWRPESIVFFGWLKALGLGGYIEQIRVQAAPIYVYLPEWVVYSLPNGLWAFSYALIITAIWWPACSVFKYLWLATIPLIGLGYETMQYLGIIPGVFCYNDLLLCFAGIVGGMAAAMMLSKRLVINI